MPGYWGTPAEAALAGRCELLVGAPDEVFTEYPQTINLGIEVFGFDVILRVSLTVFPLCSGRVTMGGLHRCAPCLLEKPPY